MIKAVIFDLNGIFFQAARLSHRIEKDFGIEQDKFLPKLQEIMQEVRQPGAEPAFFYWKKALEELHLNFTEKEFWDYWFSGEKISARMFAFAKELQDKDVKVFILSNNFKERALHYKRHDLISKSFDKVYYSWETGFIKPDARAWQHILEDNHLQSYECLYFDDQEKNVEAAQKTGIKAFLFTNEEELEKIVNSHLTS